MVKKKKAVAPDAFGELPEKGEKKVEKKAESTTDLQKLNDKIVELTGELATVKTKLEASEDLHKTKDTNLANMRKSLDTATKKLEDAGEKKEASKDGLFKDIKTSKDLTQDERDDMTETEIKQMDMIASLQAGMNAMNEKLSKGTTTEEGKEEKKPETMDYNNKVKEYAKELAGDNVEMANQIIEATKMFNLTGLDEAGIKERVSNATKHVPDYQPPKEQSGGQGGAVKETGDAGAVDIDSIVESASAEGDGGNYQL